MAKKYKIGGVPLVMKDDLTLRELKEITTKIEPERFFEIILTPANSDAKFPKEMVLDLKESEAEKIINDFWEERKKKIELSLQNSMNLMTPKEE